MSETSTIAFVAGATGHTGREVVRALRDRGAQTFAHVRPDSGRREHWQTHFASFGAEVDLTPWEPHAMGQTLARIAPTHVFACLGTTRARGKQAVRAGEQAPSYHSVDYGLTALLIDAAAQCASDPCFVYISAAGVPSSNSRSVAAGANVRSAYMRARVDAEAHLRQSGLPALIARPSFIVGERDERRVGEHVGSVVGDAVLGVLGALGARKLRARYRSTTNVELAEALVSHALAHPRDGDGDGERVRVIEADALRSTGGPVDLH